MKTVIYYFTGTGNSLAAARRIAAALGDCELIPIASLQNAEGTIAPEARRLGIVCPVYDGGVPLMVAEFAGKLDLSQADYVFSVVTMGGMGVSALHQLDGIFREGQGRRLDAAFAVRMPGNFPPLYRPPTGAKRDKILTAAERQLGEIAEAIARCQAAPPGFSPISAVMKALTYGPFCRNVHGMGRNFSESDACTGCGTCSRVCPAGNIEMVDGRPAWGDCCELCCACLHFCPVEAIQLDMLLGTNGRGRYRHPGVKVADMEAQAGAVSPQPR